MGFPGENYEQDLEFKLESICPLLKPEDDIFSSEYREDVDAPEAMNAYLKSEDEWADVYQRLADFDSDPEEDEFPLGSFDDFLEAEGIRAEVEATARNRVSQWEALQSEEIVLSDRDRDLFLEGISDETPIEESREWKIYLKIKKKWASVFARLADS